MCYGFLAMGDLVILRSGAVSRERPADFDESCFDCLTEEQMRIRRAFAEFDRAISRTIDILFRAASIDYPKN